MIFLVVGVLLPNTVLCLVRHVYEQVEFLDACSRGVAYLGSWELRLSYAVVRLARAAGRQKDARK